MAEDAQYYLLNVPLLPMLRMVRKRAFKEMRTFGKVRSTSGLLVHQPTPLVPTRQCEWFLAGQSHSQSTCYIVGTGGSGLHCHLSDRPIRLGLDTTLTGAVQFAEVTITNSNSFVPDPPSRLY